MANFTDSSVLPYLTSYKPYVQQNPVDAMYAVGVQKQQQYQQGVQRIQGEIDKVAGMDIVRPIDREYLKTKLSALNGELNKVAAADFSNFQLTNSVGGMISSIAKDNNIRNAYASTAKYRQGVSDMEAAIKEGKSSPSNEWDFGNQVNQWMGSTNIKDTFNGSYQPYTNYKKNAIELIKNLKPDANIREDAFTYDSKGRLTIADAIVKKELKGIDPKKVQEALMAGLTPGDFKQLEIDGRYNYANASPQDLQNRLNSSYNSTLQSYVDQRKVLQNSLSSTTSLPAQNQIKDQITNLDRTIKGISGEQESLNYMLASGNTDAVKAHLHTNEFINNFSRAFSYTETSETYQDSPFVKNLHWKAEQDWDKLKFQYTYSQKERELALKGKELDLKKKEGESRFGGLGSSVDQKTLPSITPTKIIEEVNTKENQLKTLDDKFYNTEAFGGRGKEWFDQQLRAYSEGKPVTEPVKRYIENTQDFRNDVLAKKSMLIDVRSKAAKELGIPDVEQYVNSLIPNDKPIQVDGYTYTPKDFVDFNTIGDRYISHIPSPISSTGTGGAGKTQYDLEKAKSELPANLYHLLEIQAKPTKMTDSEKELYSRWRHYNEIVNLKAEDTLRKIDEITQQKLNERITSPQGVIYSLESSKPELQKQNAQMFNQFIQLADNTSKSLGKSPEFNIQDAQALMADSKSEYNVDFNEGTEYQDPSYTLNVRNDKNSVSINITPEQYQQVFGRQFQTTPEAQYVKPFVEQIRRTGGITTAFDGGETNHENAYIPKSKFTNPNLKYYGLNANITQVGDDRYVLNMNIYDPLKKEWIDNVQYPTHGSLDRNALGQSFNQIDTNVIFSLIHGENMTRSNEEQLRKESAKPF